MAKRRARPQAGVSSRGREKSGAGALVLGFVLGGAAACGAGYLYLHGHARETVTPPQHATAAPSSRAAGELPALGAGPVQAPFGSSEEVFEVGAHVYAARCASCHGTPRRDAAARVRSPQLFRVGRKQVSARSPGELFRGIAVGAPAKGMPAYAGVLGQTEIWQVALLLESADQPLPDPVSAILDR